MKNRKLGRPSPASKLKKEAVTAAKIKNGAISGAKLNLSQLGTVPSATHASSADTAGQSNEATKAGEADHAMSAGTATLANSFSRYFTSGIVRTRVGQHVTLWQAGPFTATGVCEDLGGGEFEATTYLTTSAPHSSMASSYYDYEEAEFEPGEEATIGYPVESTDPEVGE